MYWNSGRVKEPCTFHEAKDVGVDESIVWEEYFVETLVLVVRP
jgi:hypothetical protein